MIQRVLSWTAGEPEAGMRMEEFLRARGCSHHVITRLKKTERGICLNGEWAYTNQRLAPGDVVQICIAEEASSEHIVPVALPLSIVYEDEDLMVVNKPADMPIHPSFQNYDNTLANAAAYYFAQQQTPFVYRCINRLDRDTSGLLILAKHILSGAILSKMSAGREIHREYLAIAQGCLPDAGTIDAPIARQEGSVLMRCVDEAHGERAVTHYRRLLYHQPDGPDSCGLSLAAVRLETGRTHQIRVHMKHIGHPLIGDFLYNPLSTALISRQALHSHRLTFRHPISGERMDFTCKLPEDMQNIFPSFP